MLQDNATCKSLCISTIPAEDAKFVNDRIREDYALNWLVDGLPAAEMKIDVKSGDMFYDMGFNLGRDDGANEAHPHLNNHYDIVLRCDAFYVTHRRFLTELQISLAQSRKVSRGWGPCVAFQVCAMFHRPRPPLTTVSCSRGDSQDGILDCDSTVPPYSLSETGDNRVRFTYRVMWNVSRYSNCSQSVLFTCYTQESSTPWVSRFLGPLSTKRLVESVLTGYSMG